MDINITIDIKIYVNIIYLYLDTHCVQFKGVFIYMYLRSSGVEGKRGLCDLNVTSSSPPLATRHYTVCSWSIAQIS